MTSSFDTNRPPLNPLKVAIADDHSVVSEALARILEAEFGMATTTAKSVNELLSKAKSGDAFDVVMLDIYMEGMRGMQTIKSLCNSLQPTKIVLFSGSADASFVKQAVECGAKGIIPKEMHIKAIESAIRLVHNDEVFLPASFMSMMSVGAKSDNDVSTLSSIEKTILKHAADGRTNKEIAIYTGSTEMQIKMSMRAICKKLDAKNRTHAAIKARELMII